MTADTSLSSDANAVFDIARHVAVEYFEDGALILDLRGRTLVELSASDSWILSHLGKQQTVMQVAEDYAETFGISSEASLEVVTLVCEKLGQARCLRLVSGSWKGGVMNDTRYVQNPDVNLREEDQDGALLYNPDRDQVQLLNSTGLYIWKLCAHGHSTGELVSALQADFDETPADAVAGDVEEFVNRLVDCGFLGTLQSSK